VLASFLITYRETLEASLVIGVMLAYLYRTNNRQHNKYVYWGTVSAVFVSVISALLFQKLAGGFTGIAEEIFEGITMLVAAVLISFMILWMLNQKHIKQNIEHKVLKELQKKHLFGLFTISFISVLREGVETVKHQVLISWELPLEPLIDVGEGNMKPQSISKFYTLSLHEKSTLGIDLTSWRGKPFTDEEKQGFDISKLLGVPCMLSVVDKNNKSKVSGVMGLPKGMACPDAINKPVLYEMDKHLQGDSSVFDSLSEGLQKLVKKAIEFNPSADNSEYPEARSAPVEDDFEDDIPFS